MINNCFVIFSVIAMGFSATEARIGLRACQGDVTLAVDYITRQREASFYSYRMFYGEGGGVMIYH